MAAACSVRNRWTRKRSLAADGVEVDFLPRRQPPLDLSQLRRVDRRLLLALATRRRRGARVHRRACATIRFRARCQNRLSHQQVSACHEKAQPATMSFRPRAEKARGSHRRRLRARRRRRTAAALQPPGVTEACGQPSPAEPARHTIVHATLFRAESREQGVQSRDVCHLELCAIAVDQRRQLLRQRSRGLLGHAGP